MPRSSHKPSPEIALYLFGAFQLELRQGASTRPIRLTRRKVEYLLAYLTLFPNPAGHAREKLAALFWGDTTDEQARMSLRTSLAVLRQALGSDAIIADRDYVQINPSFKVWIDVQEFLRARPSAPVHAAELYRGDLLADCYDDWVTAERERLRGLYIDTVLVVIQQERSQSEYENAIAWARKLLAIDPACEAAHQHAIFCEMARGNRAGALAQYAACEQSLRAELGVKPSRETQALHNWIMQAPVSAASDAARISNLPVPLTSFIGRKSELTQIKSLLAQTRLLTLVGAGGSGKTRLSIQISMDWINAPQFSDGVWWTELANLTDQSQVALAVAKALGVGPVPRRTTLEALANFLRGKKLFLILDNCEHVIDACAQLAETLLRECADLKILATSREPLNIPGETVYHIPTLGVPRVTATREELMMQYESVRLFVERAAMVKPGFTLTEKNVDAVAQICRRLDGIPLAIELAAARVPLMLPEEIARRLDDRFTLLTSGNRTALPRQQTLRALVDWSFDLLAPVERTLFHRLAVFSGGRTLDAAEQVCAFGGIEKSQVLDLLTRLVNKSLLYAEDKNGEMRFGFLDTIKQYARQKLELAGEADVTHLHHLDYFLNLAERATLELEGPRQIEWLDRLEKEHANIRIALNYAVAHARHESALRFAIALFEFWYVRGYINEGRAYFQQAIQASRSEFAASTSNAFRLTFAWALVKAGELAGRQGDFATQTENSMEGLTLFREWNDKHGMAYALLSLGSLARMQGDWQLAKERIDASLVLARELGNNRYQATALRQLGILNEFQGHYSTARALLEDSLRLAREQDDLRSISMTLSNLGNIAQQQGDYAGARNLYDQVLDIERATGAKWSIAAALLNIGNVAHSEGDYVTAQNYHEQTLKIMRELGDKRGLAIVLTNLGNALLSQGNFEPALKLHNESLELRRGLGDKRGIALTLGNLGDIQIGKNNFIEAQALYADALVRLLELGDKRTSVNCLIGAAQAAVGLGEYTHAAKLAGAIHVLRATIDAEIDIRERAVHEHVTRQAQAHLDQAAFNAAWTEGEQLSMEQAIALVEASQK